MQYSTFWTCHALCHINTPCIVNICAPYRDLARAMDTFKIGQNDLLRLGTFEGLTAPCMTSQNMTDQKGKGHFHKFTRHCCIELCECL